MVYVFDSKKEDFIKNNALQRQLLSGKVRKLIRNYILTIHHLENLDVNLCDVLENKLQVYFKFLLSSVQKKQDERAFLFFYYLQIQKYFIWLERYFFQFKDDKHIKKIFNKLKGNNKQILLFINQLLHKVDVYGENIYLRYLHCYSYKILINYNNVNNEANSPINFNLPQSYKDYLQRQLQKLKFYWNNVYIIKKHAIIFEIIKLFKYKKKSFIHLEDIKQYKNIFTKTIQENQQQLKLHYSNLHNIRKLLFFKHILL